MNKHDALLDILRQKNHAPFSLGPGPTALLVIDVQRYFVHPEYAFAQVFERLSPGVTKGYFQRVRDTVIPRIQQLLAAFRSRTLPIFFTATGTQMGDGRDLPVWQR